MGQPILEKSGIIKKCLSCGKEIYVKPSEIDTKNYCSVKCWTQSDRSREIVSITQKEAHRNNPRIGEKNHQSLGSRQIEFI